MILRAYSEPQWIAYVFFGIVFTAFIVSQYYAGKPESKEEERLLKIYRDTYNQEIKIPSAETEGVDQTHLIP